MNKRHTLFAALILIGYSAIANAKSTQNIDKSVANSEYGFINYLNATLKDQIPSTASLGISHVSTFKKNQQIIVQVIHNPHKSYSLLIDDIAQSASRVNGVNFQRAFTLNVLNGYCRTGLFYEIQAEGLSKEVVVQYEDLKGKRIAVHRINRKLCAS